MEDLDQELERLFGTGSQILEAWARKGEAKWSGLGIVKRSTRPGKCRRGHVKDKVLVRPDGQIRCYVCCKESWNRFYALHRRGKRNAYRKRVCLKCGGPRRRRMRLCDSCRRKPRPCPRCGAPRRHQKDARLCASCATVPRWKRNYRYELKPCKRCGGPKPAIRGRHICDECRGRKKCKICAWSRKCMNCLWPRPKL